MPVAGVPVHTPSPARLPLSSRFLHDLPGHRGLPDCRRPLGRDRTTCLTLVHSHRGIALRFSCPIAFSGPCPSSSKSTPRCDHDHLSFTASPIPVTPPRSPDGGILALTSSMFIPFCLVFRVFSSTLLPALHRPCLFGTPRESATLCPSSLRDLLVDSVCCRLWQHQRQDRRASLGKTHHLPISRPASCQVGSPDIRPRLVTSARPPSQHHLAGSLFATYTGSASCFLQTPRFPEMPLPCWRRPSVR
jgi:hypothetical protein